MALSFANVNTALDKNYFKTFLVTKNFGNHKNSYRKPLIRGKAIIRIFHSLEHLYGFSSTRKTLELSRCFYWLVLDINR